MSYCAYPVCTNRVDGQRLVCTLHRAERVAECTAYIAKWYPERPVRVCHAPAHVPHNCTPTWTGGQCKPCTECHFCGEVHQPPEAA